MSDAEQKFQYRVSKEDVEAFSEQARKARENLHDMLLGLDLVPTPAMHRAATILMLLMAPSPEEASVYRFLIWKSEQEHDLSDTEVEMARRELRDRLAGALDRNLYEEAGE